jgi:hypothetical protein
LEAREQALEGKRADAFGTSETEFCQLFVVHLLSRVFVRHNARDGCVGKVEEKDGLALPLDPPLPN